jgi:threonine aldolase
MLVHVDGARFASALARQDLAPAEASWKLGVDVLSFGATKGGALAAEAVLFFDPARAAGMAERRKRSGHLLSKHRFIAAQLEVYLTNDLWLTLARHANSMADLLASRLGAAGCRPVWRVEANEVFVRLSRDLDERLRQAGASYHPWMTGSLPLDVGIAPHEVLVRLVTSFATRAEQVEEFADLIGKG